MAAWYGREPLLRGAAELWIISDPITPADAVVVLGGGLEIRPFVAADLYRRGLVNKVLVSLAVDEPAGAASTVAEHTELNRAILLKLGVPAGAIEIFGRGNRNTSDEAVALRQWSDRNTVSVLIVPTEVFSARRVRWIFQRQFLGTNVKIEVPSFEAVRYTSGEWWKTERGVLAFQNEILKYLYYRCKY